MWYRCDTDMIPNRYRCDTAFIMMWYRCDPLLFNKDMIPPRYRCDTAVWYRCDIDVMLVWYCCDTAVISMGFRCVVLWYCCDIDLIVLWLMWCRCDYDDNSVCDRVVVRTLKSPPPTTSLSPVGWSYRYAYINTHAYMNIHIERTSI